jgi:hypothetical protein
LDGEREVALADMDVPQFLFAKLFDQMHKRLAREIFLPRRRAF